MKTLYTVFGVDNKAIYARNFTTNGPLFSVPQDIFKSHFARTAGRWRQLHMPADSEQQAAEYAERQWLTK